MVAKQELPGQIEPLTDGSRLTAPLWFAWFTFLRDTLATFLGAWRATFTPVATAGAGGPPTVTASCRFLQTGRTVSVQLQATITALNGASGPLLLSLPVAPAARNAVLFGSEIALTGKAVRGVIGSGGSTVSITYFDNTTVLAVNNVVVLNGIYEV
ncbi:hypothetical protein JQ581_29935 [Bradyrhizobium liaoningense]|uniref:hypothetical protein n=1 Tax=Bradyrhizobium liaoningense TaxID=43992 RepID=UPI001BAA018C|nr:hypothetical protein [Bradyrhizobium liaoningense]MBR0741160.1 hypothetical protein [Bradyrhizobium liaoningense]